MDGEDMDKPMTPRDILSKVDSEGDWASAFMWGLRPEDSDDPSIQVLIADARASWELFEATTQRLEAALEVVAEPEVLIDEC